LSLEKGRPGTKSITSAWIRAAKSGSPMIQRRQLVIFATRTTISRSV
jgi:hypothetical protein